MRSFTKLFQKICVFALTLTIGFGSFGEIPVHAQEAQSIANNALNRGFRTGYSDGYMSGYRDSVEKNARGVQSHREYVRADRAYNNAFGALEDYRDGYQQGFEKGYSSGFERRPFETNQPTDLTKRGATLPPVKNGQVPPVIAPTNTLVPPANPNSLEPIIIIPAETEFVVELLDELNTETSKKGDKFRARVISPYEIENSVIEGRVVSVEKPGRVKKRAEIQVGFDIIRLNEMRWANFSALLTEVLPQRSDNVKKVDPEGTVQGKGTMKSDVTVVAATTGVGAGVGAVVGGPVGAAVGAAVGAGFGLGGVLVSKGNNISLSKGQQMRLRTSYESQIR